MVKCVLLFLFLSLISCSQIDEEPEILHTIFTQIGEISKFERNGKVLLPDTLSDDLWIFRENLVSVWGIDGDIPDSLMIIQQNSVAVLGENAILAKVFALQFSRIILKPSLSEEKKLKIVQKFDGILIDAENSENIVLKTDGVFWQTHIFY